MVRSAPKPFSGREEGKERREEAMADGEGMEGCEEEERREWWAVRKEVARERDKTKSSEEMEGDITAVDVGKG